MPVPDQEPLYTPEQNERITDLAHAIQTGVMVTHTHVDPGDGSPKHLRTGINLRAVENSALARLLIRKGIINKAEWAEALIAGMEEEVNGYQDRLTAHFGKPVTLA